MYIYLLYLTPYGRANDPLYVKVGYTSQLGGVIDNYSESIKYQLHMGYHWELPSTATATQANAIKKLLAKEVGSLSPEETKSITNQLSDLYLMRDYERVFDVLHEIISNYNFEIVPKRKEIKRTKPNTTKSLHDDLPREEQLKSIVSRWLGNKTVDKLQQLLPAFKNNNKKYSSDEIDSMIIKLILGK